jgi:ABC-type oligopeptide transport system ATPase subunit
MKEPKHTFITGHSGSGKTTLGRKIEEETGQERIRLDKHPAVLNFWENLEPASEWPNLTEADEKKKQIAFRKAIKDVLSRKKPVIAEGTQVLSALDMLKNTPHRKILVDPSERAVVRRRLNRDVRKGHVETFGRKKRREMAHLLMKEFKDRIAKVRKDPEWEKVSSDVSKQPLNIWLNKIKNEAKEKGYDNYFMSVEDPNHPLGGGSLTSTTKKDNLMRALRKVQVEWEKKKGLDPDHDWGNQFNKVSKEVELRRALEQLKTQVNDFNPRKAPSSHKEPVHIKFGPSSHYGEHSKHGPHFATTLDGHNVHLYKNKIFNIAPDGKASRRPLSPSLQRLYDKLMKVHMSKSALELDIKKGDILLGGRFKNKREVVKTLGRDELGQPTVNGKKLLNFRIEKHLPEDKKSSKTREMEKTSLKRKVLSRTIHNISTRGGTKAYARSLRRGLLDLIKGGTFFKPGAGNSPIKRSFLRRVGYPVDAKPAELRKWIRAYTNKIIKEKAAPTIVGNKVINTAGFFRDAAPKDIAILRKNIPSKEVRNTIAHEVAHSFGANEPVAFTTGGFLGDRNAPLLSKVKGGINELKKYFKLKKAGYY